MTEPVAFHGEGPVWAAAWGGLRWLDMLAGDVLSMGTDGTVARRHVGTIAAALRPRRGGGAVIAVERGFVLEAPDGDLSAVIGAPMEHGTRMNDGGCDPDGRFYCGSMAYDGRAGAGALYRFDPDRSVHQLFNDVTISNGLDWSPDGTRAYYVDTPIRRIDLFDYERDAGLTNRRPFADRNDADGVPDGLTVDDEGGVWVALNGGGAVRRYTAEGALDVVVETSTRHVTACTFGGPDLRTLFITTSRENVRDADDRVAGSLLAADPGVAGRPASEFIG